MRIEPLGDSALLVRVVEEFEAEKSLDAVLRATQQLELAEIPGVIELVPAYTTIGIFLDPARIEAFDQVRTNIERALEQDLEGTLPRVTTSIIEVPVCYESEFALDLEEVARHAGLPQDEIIHRHSTAIYRVSCVGFTPGFAYLSGLPPELATPRRASPRKEVPAGAVAIGGTQTGVYPRKSPGGWNIIGRAPLRFFDVERNPPALFQAGDRVRFRKILREEFDQLMR
ncbi:MAG TPA: 5-oxoprolinase subunit PxpB [Chthoniobacterales bacterium]|jgi:inhibitor of KinA|nr:5-oxoprolinase subunit PxpB [Chthoniobacterales bacterium]